MKDENKLFFTNDVLPQVNVLTMNYECKRVESFELTEILKDV